MDVTPFETNQIRKKKILRILYIFIGIMLFLTFFSNTINNLSLSRVSTEQPISGALIKEVTTSGVVQPKESIKIYSDQGRLVDEVKVRLGDKVKKGQVIVVLNKDILEQQMKEQLLRYDQMKLELEKLTDSKPDIEFAEKNLETAKNNLAIKRTLFDAGAVSDEDVKQAENSLLLAEKDLNDEKRMQRDNARDIKSQQDSIQLEELSIEKLRKKLNEESILVSSVDGIINELNVIKGSMVIGDEPLFSIADISKGFETRIAVSREKAEYLAIGDNVDITIRSLGGNVLSGSISEIAESTQDRGEKKDLLIDVPYDGVFGGEQCNIYISKKTTTYKMLIPNIAVGTDEKGKFVWILKERKGPLGSEFYVLRAAVAINDSDSTKTAILNGITPDEYIVVGYSKALEDGSRVIPDK